MLHPGLAPLLTVFVALGPFPPRLPPQLSENEPNCLFSHIACRGPFDADNADEAFNSLLCEMVDEVIALLKLNVALAIAAPGNQPTKHPRDVDRFECGGGIGSIDFVEK